MSIPAFQAVAAEVFVGVLTAKVLFRDQLSILSNVQNGHSENAE